LWGGLPASPCLGVFLFDRVSSATCFPRISSPSEFCGLTPAALFRCLDGGPHPQETPRPLFFFCSKLLGVGLRNCFPWLQIRPRSSFHFSTCCPLLMRRKIFSTLPLKTFGRSARGALSFISLRVTVSILFAFLAGPVTVFLFKLPPRVIHLVTRVRR